MRWFIILAAAAMIALPAETPAAGERNPLYGDVAPLAPGELGQVRGRFTTAAGLEIDLAIDSQTFIDGALVDRGPPAGFDQGMGVVLIRNDVNGRHIRQLTTIDLDILNFSAVQGEAISRRLGLRISNQVGQQLISSLPP